MYKKLLKTSSFSKLRDFFRYRLLLVDSILQPSSVWIEPTNNCNLDCVFCPRGKSSKKVGYMDIDLYKKIVDEISTYDKSVNLNLHVSGEPLLHPKIIEMVKYAKQKENICLNFSTNGMLLSGDIAEQLVEAKLDSIQISYDACIEEEYESTRRKASSYIVSENINRLIELKRKKCSDKPRVQIVHVLYRDGIDNKLRKFVNKWQKKVDSIDLKPLLSWSSGLINSGKRSSQERFPCQNIWTSPAIMWDGDVCVCCLYIELSKARRSGTVGNVNSKTLSEIWSNGLISYIRLRHLRNDYDDIPFCKYCTDWCDVYKAEKANYWNKYLRHTLLKQLNK